MKDVQKMRTRSRDPKRDKEGVKAKRRKARRNKSRRRSLESGNKWR